MVFLTILKHLTPLKKHGHIKGTRRYCLTIGVLKVKVKITIVYN